MGTESVQEEGHRQESHGEEGEAVPGVRQKVVLDLCCGAGGAGKGYADAGFRVIGVDIVDQPDYPFEFHRADALEWLKTAENYDAVHASPPCQASSALTKGSNQGKVDHVDQIGAFRTVLRALKTPYVIENVVTAQLRPDLMLCGTMFGLRVLRHRWFEATFAITQPRHAEHRGRVSGWRHGRVIKGSYLGVWGQGGYKGTVQEWQQGLGIDWTSTRQGLANAIPPAYTHHIGQALQEAL